jgi:hypothetical protein
MFWDRRLESGCSAPHIKPKTDTRSTPSLEGNKVGEIPPPTRNILPKACPIRPSNLL